MTTIIRLRLPAIKLDDGQIPIRLFMFSAGDQKTRFRKSSNLRPKALIVATPWRNFWELAGGSIGDCVAISNL